MKLAILAALGAATVALAPSPAEAQMQRQLQFFNKCPFPVRYFIAIPRGGGWQTYGWFTATGNKPVHNLLDQYRNPIYLREGARLHYYAETTGGPSTRWAGNVPVVMNNVNYSTKPATLSVRGGNFQFGLNCNAQAGINTQPPPPPRRNYAPGPGRRNGGGSYGWVRHGARVLCRFADGAVYYPGRIAQINPQGAIEIAYDDGDREWTTAASCRPE